MVLKKMSYVERIYRCLQEILKLTLPITTAFVAMGLMGIVDTIIVGHYQTDQLAYIGLANSIFMVLFTIPIALLQGVLIKSSQKFGARKFASCGKIYNEGRKYLVVLAVLFTLPGLFGESILRLLGQDPVMAQNAGEVLRIFVFSIPFILVYVNSNFFLQSIKRPYVGMYGILAANVLNLMINPVLVYGLLNFPEMGACGSATSTLIVRIFLAVYIQYYIYRMKRNPKLNHRFGLDRSYDTWWNDSRTTRKIGFGIAITTVATNGSFSIVSTFAGWMGAHTMAMYVIMLNVIGMMFMICFSIAQSTSIVVANNFGKRSREGIIASTIAGYLISFVVILVLSVAVALFPTQVFGIFTSDETLISAINAILGYVLLYIVLDTVPLGIYGALNGRGDVKIPTINQVISFLGVSISTCYMLAFGYDLGIRGVLLGMSCGGFTSLVLNTSRFLYLRRQDLKYGLPAK